MFKMNCMSKLQNYLIFTGTVICNASSRKALNMRNHCGNGVHIINALNSRCRLNISTHWGWVSHICVGNLNVIGSANGMSPDRRQAITWTQCWNAFKMSSAKRRPFCLGLNVLTSYLQLKKYLMFVGAYMRQRTGVSPFCVIVCCLFCAKL